MTEQIAGVQEPVKTPEDGTKEIAPIVPAVKPDVDYQTELAKRDAEIKRITEVSNNYKRGLLKAKGKVEDETEEDEYEESSEERTRRIIREELANTDLAKALAEKEALVSQMANELSEAKLAIKNRSGMTPSSGAAGAEETAQKDNVLSEQQIQNLKARGFDDKMIEQFKKNLQEV